MKLTDKTVLFFIACFGWGRCYCTSHECNERHSYTVFMLEKGRKINENRYCPRGLESETETGKAEAEAKTKAAKAAVLKAQAEGIDDPEIIANIYSNISSPCLQEAQSNGVADQKAALE